MKIDIVQLCLGIIISLIMIFGILGSAELLREDTNNLKNIGFYTGLTLLLIKELSYSIRITIKAAGWKIK